MTSALNADLVTRLNEYVAYFDAVETKPTPHELYYAIKNDGEGTGWRYRATGFGPSDIREAALALSAQAERISVLERALEPFSVLAGELFARNYNRSDPVVTLTGQTDMGPAEMSLTFEAFLNARTTLTGAR